MGRYAERVESVARLLRATARRLFEGDPSNTAGFGALTALCDAASLRERSTEDKARREKRKAAAPPANGDEWLLAALGDPRIGNGLPANTGRLLYCATQLRDRMSLDNWHTVQALARVHEPAPQNIEAALAVLDRVLPACTTLTGYAFDDMTRDDAWHFLITGRRLERITFICSVIAALLRQPEPEREAALSPLLEIGNTTITYRARYQRQPELLPVLDLLALDEANPHAVCFQLAALCHELETLDRRLGFFPSNDPRPLLQALRSFDLDLLDPVRRSHSEAVPFGEALSGLLAACERCAYGLSDEIAQRFFVHAGERAQASFAA
jgi:uncharacterized alpha-E superfamily protein